MSEYQMNDGDSVWVAWAGLATGCHATPAVAEIYAATVVSASDRLVRLTDGRLRVMYIEQAFRTEEAAKRHVVETLDGLAAGVTSVADAYR